MQRWLALSGLMLLLLSGSHSSVRAAGPASVYFSQTGHHVDDAVHFLSYWRAHGQIPRLGYPITEPFEQNGLVVQYFERARFEYHPKADVVLLGLLGTELGVSEPAVEVASTGRYFPETGHNLNGEFLDYWQRYAGLATLGYPLTEERDEAGLVVQWFERGRLEYHPEAMEPLWQQYEQARNLDLDPLYEIIPSSVGRMVAAAYGIDTAPVPQRSDAPNWSPHLWQQSIRVSLSSYTLEAYEDDLPVLEAPIAIGKPGFETVTGTFQVYSKWWRRDMRSSERGESWDTKAVPFTQFFYRDWAIHGTYWHTDFGSRRSHGCVNLPLDAAEWLYGWTQPGTSVTVVP